MKSICLLLLLTLRSCSTGAQRVHFVDTANRWEEARYSHNQFPQTGCYAYNGGEVCYRRFRFERDTVINGVQWYWFPTWNDSPPGGGSWLVREDTLLTKVYLRRKDSAATQLLYDHDWHLGDTIALNNGGLPELQFRVKVLNIDSVLIQGVYHRIFRYSDSGTAFSIQGWIVEGIGDLHGHGQPLLPLFFELQSELKCFFHAGMKPSVTGPPAGGPVFSNTGNCIPTGVRNAIAGQSGVQIAPQPVTAASRLLLPRRLAFARLTVFNSTGQVVQTGNYFNTDEIPVGGLISQAGFYCYRIAGENSVLYTGRFFIQ